MSVHVTIDRVVLQGMDPSARAAFVRGLRSELARVLAGPEARAGLGQSRRTPVLKLGPMPLAPGAGGAGKLGQSVARAVGRGGTR